jgi:hypothetical protein
VDGNENPWSVETMTKTTINLTIPDDAWEAIGWNDGPPHDRLLAQVVINGTHHHLDAYRATVEPDGCVVLANPAMEEEQMPLLQALYDGGYDLTTIRGERYVVVMYPHAN